jgi:hypothetical protein
MTEQQDLINVLKNIKAKSDSRIAWLGTKVFLGSFSINKAKEFCIKTRETVTLSDLLHKP